MAEVARVADPRLVAQDIVGAGILADLDQRDGGADIACIAKMLPIGQGEIGLGVLAG